MSGKRTLYWIVQALVLVGLGYYIHRIGTDTIAKNIQVMNAWTLAGGMAVIILANLLRPWRSSVILKGMGAEVKWRHLFRWSQEAWFLSVMTPGKVGEFYRAVRIEKAYGVLGAGTLATVFDRLLDTFIILTLGLLAISIHANPGLGRIRLLTAGLVLGLVLFVITFATSRRARKYMQHIARFIPHRRLRTAVDEYLTKAGRTMQKLEAATIFHFLIISAIIWTFYIFGFNLLFKATSIDLGFFPFLACFALALFVQSLPITLFGFGTREAALITFLDTYSVAPQESLTISLLFGLASIVSMIIPTCFWFTRSQHL